MSTRDRTILGVICLVVAIVAPYLLLISPKRAQANKLETQIGQVQSQLSTVQAQLAQGEQARAQFASSYTTLVRLGEAVPTDDNTPSLIYQLQAAAKGTDVQFQGLTFDAGQGGSSSSTPSPSSSSSTTLPPGATVGPAGFPVEPFTFTFAGNFFHLSDFIGRLQRFVTENNNHLAVSGRLMSLNGITLEPNTGGFPQITATVSATTYLLPASEGLLNGATPAGPSSSSTTQTVSNSSPSSSSAPPAVVTSPVR
ncbi:MAG TPA: type II secretion system protein GspM [Solirubrobacteraceae bacterium]|nr:type II secretion system protein GspM [Solirubrobacteraceae bacterium]